MATGVTIDFTAKIARFQNSIDKMTDSMNRFEKNGQRVAKNFRGSFQALATFLPVAAFAAATKKALDYADSIADAAEQTNFSAKRLQELKYAAGQTGIEFTTLTGALARFDKRLGLARSGAGAAAKTYQQLGIDLSQTNDQVFNEVVETLGNMEDATNRNAIATRLFGDDAQRMGVLLAGGRESLDAFAKRAEELGLIIGDDLVQGASDANDKLDTLQQVISIRVTKALVALAPVIDTVAEKFTNAAVSVAEFFNAFDEPTNTSAAQLKTLIAERGKLYEAQNKVKENIAKLERVLQDDGPDDVVERELAKQQVKLRALKQQILDNQSLLAATNQQIQASLPKPSLPDKDKPKDEPTGYFGDIKTLKREAQQWENTVLTAQEKLAKQLKRIAELRASNAFSDPIFADRAEAKAIADFYAELEKANTVLAKSAEGVSKTKTEIERFADGINATYDPLRGLSKFMVDLDTALRDNLITWDVYAEATLDSLEDIEDAAGSAVESVKDLDGLTVTIESNSDDVAEAARELGLTFTSAFEDAIVKGEDLGAVLRGLEEDILRIVTRKLVTEPLTNMFSDLALSIVPGLFGGSSAGTVSVGNVPTNAFPSLSNDQLALAAFGGLRAEGGSVSQNKWHVVGEKGPEVFIPKTSGYVVPNDVLEGRKSASTLPKWVQDALQTKIDMPKREAGGNVIAMQNYLTGEKGPELFVARGMSAPEKKAEPAKTTVINMNISTPDADSFRKSRMQIMQDLRNVSGRM